MDFDIFPNDEANFAFYIEELKSDDNNIRINAATKISNIAEILGSKKVKEQFIPYLTGIIEERDNDEEFLVNIIDQLGKIGSGLLIQDIHLILDILETLLCMEEPIVREKAIENMIKISEGQTQEYFSKIFIFMVKRLAARESYTCRISSCSLVPICYQNATFTEKLEIRQLYAELVHDDNAMVRRAAAANLKNMIKILKDDIIKADIIPLFTKLIKDSVDSVKIVSIENSIYLVPYYPRNEINNTLLALLKNIDAETKSWKVKCALADCLVTVAEQLDTATVRRDIFPIYENMLKDQEQEVRANALLKLPELYERLSIDQIENHLLPLYTLLLNDLSHHVRISLSKVIPYLASCMDINSLIKLVLPLIKNLYKDEITEVRITLIQNIKVFNKIIGINNIKVYIIPMIVSYANDYNINNNKQWRSIYSLLEILPELYKDIDFDVFNEYLSNFVFSFLYDHIYAIREQAIISIEKAIILYGYNKLKNAMALHINQLINNNNYIFRITGIYTFIKLYDHMDNPTSTQILDKLINTLGNDKIPNVRLNVIKLIDQLKNKIDNIRLKKYFYPILKILYNDKDPDVSYFANLAFHSLI